MASRGGAGGDSASLFDVVHGTSASRAVGGKSGRFTAQGRVTAAAVEGDGLGDSPSRLNPNKVLLREREGGKDQQEEAAYRRENYALFRKNLEEAFNQYNTNGDQYLNK